jgi:putative membrane protein
MPLAEQIIPYCGAPALPETLWQRWNPDPVLLATLAAIYIAYLAGDRLAGGGDRREVAAFSAGWAVAAAALVSPLCALSVALFSARVGQHMILAMVAAPLVALGRPERRLAPLMPNAWRAAATHAAEILSGKVAAGLLFALALWLWHTPFLYGATFRSDVLYWLMHATLFGSAVLLWHALIVRGLDQPLLAFATGFLTTLHMSLLGALLTFARRSFFPEHLATSAAWGLSPVEDQGLGGLIMWIPGGTALALAGIILLGQILRSLERRGEIAATPQ